MSKTHSVVQIGAASEPLRIRLGADDSDGALGVVEMDMNPDGSGPPLHIHPNHGEGFYVLAGEMTFQVGDDVISGGPGTWAFAPKGTPHTLANLSGREARILCVFAPGGFERRFARMVPEQLATPPPAELSATERGTRRVGPTLAERA